MSETISENVANDAASVCEDDGQAWLLIDAAGMRLGRLASHIAHLMLGKNRPDYQPHLNQSPGIVVINCADIAVTGNKKMDKVYYRHTGFPGGIKSINLRDLLTRKPTDPLRKAVKNMLPRGPLGRAMMKRLRLFPGSEHCHQSQNPKPYALGAH